VISWLGFMLRGKYRGRKIMQFSVVLGCLCLLLAGATERAWGAQALTDAEMDQITAGSLSVEAANGQFNFQLGGETNRVSVTGSGTVAATENVSAGPAGYVIMRDNAQSNLRAFVNVNAVNAKVSVLINLTVNINSTVGTIHQINTIPPL